MKRTALIAGFLLLAIAGAMAWSQWSAPPLPEGTVVDRVVVRKSARTLELFRQGQLIRTYGVSLGRQPMGPKQQEGDRRTPEGEYTLDYRKPNSSFHRALHVSYPSPADTTAAQARGVSPGGLIMVHGLRKGMGLIGRFHTLYDWTDGCIAVTNREIEEIWRVVPDGTPIVIEP